MPILHKRTEAGKKQGDSSKVTGLSRRSRELSKRPMETLKQNQEGGPIMPRPKSLTISIWQPCVLPPRPLLQLKDPAPHCQPEPLLWPPNQHQMTNLKRNASFVSTPPAPSSAYRILFKSKINYFSSAALWIKKKMKL